MNGRLAVVDDDRAFTDYLATWLGSRGLTVDVFHSGGAFVDSLRVGRRARRGAARRADAGPERPRHAAGHPAVQLGDAGDHAVGPPRAGHRDRSRAPRRRRLRAQARRSRRGGRSGARSRHQPRARTRGARLRGGAPGRADGRRPGRRAALLERRPGHAARDGDGGTRRRQRRRRAAARRERRRQGSDRARAASPLAAPRQART